MSSKKHSGLTRRTRGLMALEPRFMFDGAAVDSAHDTLTTTTPIETAAAPAADVFKLDASVSGLATTAQAAQQQVRDYLATASDAQLFSLFNGGKTQPDSTWSERLTELREALSNGNFHLNVVAMDSASQFTALAAFTENGPNGEPTIFINTFWFGMFDAPDATRALVEELGHAFDAYLNPNADSAGDEGEAFADTVIDGSLSAEQRTSLLTQTDQGTVTVNGVTYAVEFASLNFSNAYEMVYDWDTQNNSEDTTERWASKEQNLHYFNTASLGVVSISDGSNGTNFSGNDVSAVALTIGGQTFNGWISRPIKANGVVRGFYFWTDSDFTTLALAQADGNQDGDSSVADNRGFVLVVDQTWFNQQIADTDFTKTFTSTSKDVIDGYVSSGTTLTIASVGSSSDRVDAALNSVLPPNSAPTAANDSLTVAEDSGTTSISATASTGLLSNDSDVNNDSLTVTGYTIAGVSGTQTIGSTVTISGVGDIRINSDGSYTFAPVANYSGSAPPITYTVNDGHGGTATAVLSIAVTPVNDPPVSTDDSVSVAVNTPKLLGATDFGTYSDPESDPFTSVKITSLPTSGTLQYWNGSSWTTLTGTPTISMTDILQGNLRYVPATDTTGSPTLQFQVYDGGLLSTNSYTLTLNITGNLAPTAIADTNSVVEAGCGVSAAPAIGNVITDGTDDTDPNGNTITVTRIDAYGNTQSVASGSTSSSNGTAINGQYGTLTIGANGTYSYALNNSLPAIDAMNSGSTKTETFTYTVSDGQGGSSSTTLTITVNGTNDAPIAQDDFSSLKEGSLTGGNYGTVNGNALTNDADVDSSPITIAGSYATAVGSVNGSVTYSFSVSNSINTGNYVFFDDDGSATTSNVVLTNSPTVGEAVKLTVDYNGSTYDMLVDSTSASGTTFKIMVNSTAIAVNLNDNKQGFVFGVDSGYIGFSSSATTSGNYKVSAISSSSNPSSATVNISSITSGNIAAGMTVTDGSITRTIQSVTKNSDGTVTSMVLDSAVTWQNNSLTFSSTASPLVLTGQYGYISINTTSGAYTYTLTSNALNDGQVFAEKFSYRATDGSCTDDATITVRIAGASAPYLQNDTLVVAEDSGSHITFNGSVSGSDSLKTNDTNGTVTLGDIASFTVDGDSTTYTAGQTASISGVGALTINADGSISFDPVDNYTGPVPTITYTRTGSDSLAYKANLTITIDPVDDASVLTADANTINEDQTATGNVLSNDSDVDSVLSVSTFSFTSNGSTVSHSAGNVSQEIRDGSNNLIGTITVNTNGFYTFTPAANWNGAVPQITYTTNTGLTSTLNITVNPVNDPPVLDLDASGTGTGWNTSYTNQGSAVSIGDSDVAIADIDDTNIENATIVLTNPQSGDTLNVGVLPSGITLASGPALSNGVMTLMLTGSATLADYQAAIKAITFSSAGTSAVDRVISVQVNDGSSESNTAYATIDVNADNRLVTVMGSVVNEASPYVMFEVSGVQNQWVSLVLGTTGSGTGHATMGTDFLPNLEYLVGSTWTSYTGGLIQIADAGGKLLVRTAVLQDTPFESTQANYETLKLTAKNANNTANVTTDNANFLADGTARIRDDGQGGVYLGGNTTFVPDSSGSGFPAYLDDDRPVTVNSVVVNEASPYAVLTVSGYSGQVLNLAWIDLTAKKDGNSSGTLDGTDDYGPSLEYWDPAVGSSGGWVAYNGTSVTMSGSELYVRTAVINDIPFEGLETFALEVVKASSGAKVYGTVGIVDDGTGTKYLDDNPTDGVATDTSNLNDDRTITVTGGLTFNEASPYATFIVSAVAGAEINLTLGNTSSGSDVDATIAGFTTSYSEDGGVTWINYTWNGTTGNRPTVPANGSGTSVYGTVLVRVNIASEEEGSSDVYEGPETFTLTANYATNNAITSTGTDTIVDDGTGRIDRNGDGDTTDSNEGTGGPGAGYEDDRTIDVVGGLTFNEGSTYATFTVTGAVGSVMNMELGNTNSSGDTDATISGFSVQYNTGSGWVTYTWDGATGNRPTVPAGGTFSVRVSISSEADSPYEGAETFTLKASYATNANITDTDTDTIIDDGTGKKDDDGDGGLDEGGAKDDDRQLTVSNITVNEGNGSNYAVFSVGTVAGQTLNLTLTDGSAVRTGSGDTLDFGSNLQYWNGSAWTAYSPGFSVPGTAGANTTLLVRVLLNADSAFENSENFTLTAAYANGGAKSATGTATIKDDGTGMKFTDGDPTSNDPSTITDNTNLDDDRPKSGATLPPPTPAPAPPSPPAAELDPAPPKATPPQSFASTLTPLAPALVPADPPLAMLDAVTSGSGYQIPVNESVAPGLSLFQGITDQFIQSTDVTSKVSLPFDAFIHSNKDAVIKLEAKQVDNSKLPAWVQFDPVSGVFEVTPPQGFKGKLDLKVIARDDDGREAVAIFQMFIGEQSTTRPQTRESFSEKLRMAGKRPITLVRVSDVSHRVTTRDSLRTRAG